MAFPINIEQWRLINEYDNYEISSHGRVRNSTTALILKQTLGRAGYYYVSLWKNNKGKKYDIHRLVAFAFCVNENNKTIVDHINRVKTDNMCSNLRWVTMSENSRNTSMFCNNTSGTKGVYYRESRDVWIADWRDFQGKHCRKQFTVKQHGDNAKQLAIDYRKEMEKIYYL